MKGYTGIATGGTLVVALVSMSVAMSDFTAVAYQGRMQSQANSGLAANHAAFVGQKARSLADGTPANLLDRVTIAEHSAYALVGAEPEYFVDRRWLTDVEQRSARIDGYRREVVAVEAQVEVDLNHQVQAALQRLQAAIQPARDAGLATADYDIFLAAATTAAQDLQLPNAASRQLAAATAKADALVKATADQVTANLAAAQAVAQAKANAQDALGRAQRDLGQAQAIPVLDVSAWARAIPDLAAQLALAQTADAYNGVAGALQQQSQAIEDLLYNRNLAFQLVAEARASLTAAQGQKLPVDADAAALAVAAQALPNASNISTINGLKAQVISIKNDLDFQVQEAQWRGAAGKLILISLSKQHLQGCRTAWC